jgi:hypothetical protein
MSDTSHMAMDNKNKNNNKMMSGYQGDPSRRYPSSVGFQCGESRRETATDNHSDNDDDDDFGFWVTFHCTLPPGTTLSNGRDTLEFRCREPSCGVLTSDEPRTTTTITTTIVASKQEQQQDDDDDEKAVAVDPFMFEKGYTLAGRTGFQVWPGSRLLVEILTWPIPPPLSSSSFSRCDYWQTRLRNGARVLELGAGVGVVGASLAATGAQVLLTDLSTLVTHSIRPNLAMNSSSSSFESSIQQQQHQLSPPLSPPAWLNGTHAKPIGRGWAGATALDWTVPVNEQLPSPDLYNTIDIVVASDCVWLVSMLDALLSTVASIFSHHQHQQHVSQPTWSSPSSDQEKDTNLSPSSSSATHRHDNGPALLMSFQRRDTVEGDSSAVFTTVQRVLKDVTNRGWTMECLAWSLVHYNTEEDKEVFVFEIRPPSPAPYDNAPVE